MPSISVIPKPRGNIRIARYLMEAATTLVVGCHIVLEECHIGKVRDPEDVTVKSRITLQI